jgi:hypothetical protein
MSYAAVAIVLGLTAKPESPSRRAMAAFASL